MGAVERPPTPLFRQGSECCTGSGAIPARSGPEAPGAQTLGLGPQRKAPVAALCRGDQLVVFDAVAYVLSSGCAWADVPPLFGATVDGDRRFAVWTRTGRGGVWICGAR